MRKDVKPSSTQGRTVSPKTASRHLFIYSFAKFREGGGKKRKHLCVARGLGEVTAKTGV